MQRLPQGMLKGLLQGLLQGLQGMLKGLHGLLLQGLQMLQQLLYGLLQGLQGMQGLLQGLQGLLQGMLQGMQWKVFISRFGIKIISEKMSWRTQKFLAERRGLSFRLPNVINPEVAAYNHCIRKTEKKTDKTGRKSQFSPDSNAKVSFTD